jgi:hypothetical protein
MTEHELVKNCLTDIYKKCGYEDLSSLSQRDYDHVSQEIERVSGILISATTIKRLLNGEFSRMPQVATLNAIATFLGYKSWQEYKSHVTSQTKKAAVNTVEQPVIAPTPVVKKHRMRYIALAACVLAVVAFLVFIQFSKPRNYKSYSTATFTVKKNTSNEIPNTVVFNYNIDDVDADSFFIQQSWDWNRRVRIHKKSYTLTDIYLEPGYHVAKLIANDSIIRTVDVSIPTDRWILFAKDMIPAANPQYIKVDTTRSHGIFSADEKDLLSSHIGNDKEKEFVYIYFPSRFAADADNFRLTTRVRMKEVRSNSCPYLTIEVFCQRYYIFFKSTTKGCTSESYAEFGENFISGKDHDLASLGLDVTQWIDVDVTVVNKYATIRLNGKDVFTASYKNATGFVTGLGFISNGLCDVESVDLKGLNGANVYHASYLPANFTP